MESEEPKEMPKKGELGPRAPLKMSICWCLRMEPCAVAVITLHFAASLLFLGICCLVAKDVGQFRDRQLFSTWHKTGQGVGAFAGVHVLLSLILFLAVKMRDVTLFRGCVWLIWVLHVAALGYILYTAHAQTTSFWPVFIPVLSKIYLIGLWLYVMVCLYNCTIILKSPEVLDKLNEEGMVTA